jgi:uridine kinase
MQLSAPQPVEIRAQLDAVIDEIRSGAATCSEPVIVGVCGGTSTGKSTVVTRTLETVFRGKTTIIAQDHFQYLEVQRDALDPLYGLDHVHHYGVERCVELVQMLKAGTEAEMPVYDFKKRQHTGTQKLRANPIIIVEGLYGTFGALADQASIRVYTQSHAFERLVRRMIRNQFERYPGLPIDGNRAILSFLSRVQQAHVDFVRSQKYRATHVLDNPIRFGWLVDKHHIPVLEPLSDLEYQLRWERLFPDCQCAFRIKCKRDNPAQLVFSLYWGELPYFRTVIQPETASRIEAFDWLSQ